MRSTNSRSSPAPHRSSPPGIAGNGKSHHRSDHVKIGIIGSGNLGSTLARKLARAGHSLLIANSRRPETLKDLANETGANAVTTQDATRDVDVVILSIPFGKLPLLRDLFAGLRRDVVVADTSNYFPFRDGQIAAVDDGQVESLWVSEQIGHPVIKAWNNVLAATLRDKGLPAGAEGRIALSVAGDDPVGKQTVMSLVEDTGFDAIDAGPLAESWRQQPITSAYCTELGADQLRDALARADRAGAPGRREKMVKEFMALGDKLTSEDIVRLHRAASA
jgi:predicted dinucleotide-binding enzyme